jgi:DNA-binding beta-propeller fold protein YncE
MPGKVDVMKGLILSLAFVALPVSLVHAQTSAPLTLEAKIPLGEVHGRIDHLAVDLGRHRLFVAELENDSVGIIDLNLGKVIHVITDAKGPQGLAYLKSSDTLYVANGGDGILRLFEGEAYGPTDVVQLSGDADNIRVDAAAQKIYVAHGDGALAVIDAASHAKIADIVLKSHPESFQFDKRMDRIFINEPRKQAITIVDRVSGRSTATWKIGNASNFAMALNEERGHVLVVYRDPAKLVAFNQNSGAVAAKMDVCGDVDDIFMDTRRRRVYVSCGEGFVDVFDARGNYPRIGHIDTEPGARTSLFVPELDRFFVAARATPQEPAAVWVFRPEPAE